MPESWIQIGHVRSVNPSARRVRIRPDALRPCQLDRVTWLGVVLRDGTELRCKVASVGVVGAEIGVELALGVPRDTVAQMKGAAVTVSSGECPQGGDRDDRAEALRGFRVVKEDDTPLGRIVAAYDTAAHGVLEIEKPDGAVMLLPLVPEAIARVDVDRHVVVTVADIAPFAVEDAAAEAHKDRDED